MVGIIEYSVVKGEKVRSVAEIASERDDLIREQMYEIGLRNIPTHNERFLSDMIRQAYEMLHQHPDCILIAHSLPFISKNGVPCLSVDSVPVFCLSGLPCAIMHKAIEIACKMADAEIYKKILVIGADKAYSDSERIFFGTIMGDAVVAVLIGKAAVSNKILASEVSSTIIAPDGENSSPEEIQQFRSANASMMRAAIQRCMQKSDIDHIDHFVTHTSNRHFWNNMAVLMKIPRDIFMDDNIIHTGHMNSHDSFFHYFHFIETGKIKEGEVSMLINPGFGGTQGCTLIKT